MIKGLIFDLDGVIVDTAKNHYYAWKKIAESIGINFDKKENELIKGLSRKESLEKIISLSKSISIKKSHFNNLLIQKNEEYLNSISNINKNDILPGIEDLILYSKKNQIKLAVGSSSKNAIYILKKIDLYSYFNVIIDGTMVKNPKPQPEVFIKCCEAINLSPKECLVFEDSHSGVYAAKSGGFKVIGVGNHNLIEIADFYEYNLNGFKLEKYEKFI